MNGNMKDIKEQVMSCLQEVMKGLNLNVSIRIPISEKYWQKGHWGFFFPLSHKTGTDDSSQVL